MRHAAHKAARVSDERFSAAKALFTSSRGSHTAKAVRMVQLANGEGAVVGLDPAVAEKLNEVAPMTRRAMREAARAAERRSTIVTSASLAALVGTAATAVALTQQNSMNLLVADAATTTTQLKRVSDTSAASRSEERTALDSLVDSSDASQTSNNGEWQLGDANTIADVSAAIMLINIIVVMLFVNAFINLMQREFGSVDFNSSSYSDDNYDSPFDNQDRQELEDLLNQLESEQQS